MKRRILLVDDDKTLSGILGAFFEENDFNVFYANNGADAIGIYKKEMPELILLDLELPNISGFEVIEIIRNQDYITPIILMSGTYNNEESKIRGYELGAIQFLEKPVSPKVILAQILNKLNPPVFEKIIVIGENTYKLKNQILFTPNERIHLREREALILSLLFDNPGDLILREKIYYKIWGYVDYRNKKTLDTLMHSLKKRLEPCLDFKISNKYSKGFVLEKV